MRNPFRGLEPYSDDQPIYGRDSDFVLLKDRVFTGRTTLLFAASGAGKTSFLRAKAIPEFQKEFCCCYHREWTGSGARASLLEEIAKVVHGETSLESTICNLLDAFRKDTPQYPEGFLLILDQFEELFQSFALHPEFPIFIQDLCDLINSKNIRAKVIISLRDDFLGELSLFENRVSDLFNNYFHLQSPDEAQAREIIRRTAKEESVRVHPEKLKSLTGQLSTFTVTITGRQPVFAKSGAKLEMRSAKNGDLSEPGTHWTKKLFSRLWRRMRYLLRPWFFPSAPRTESAEVKRNVVILPYLQVVCRKIWERESGNGNFCFLDKWMPEKEKAQILLDDFCKTALDSLGSTRRKDLAARAFDFLMTQEGAKLPYEYHLLAEHMQQDPYEIYNILSTLSAPSTKMLREYSRPDGSKWFELYHDMYAIIVHDWKRKYQAHRVRQRRRRVMVAIFLAAPLIYISYLASEYSRYATLIQVARDNPPVDPYNHIRRIPLIGSRLADTLFADYWDRRASDAGAQEQAPQALFFRANALHYRENNIRRSEVASYLASVSGIKATFRTGTTADMVAVDFSPDERYVASGDRDGIVYIWDLQQGKLITASHIGVCADNSTRALSGDLPGALPGAQSSPVTDLMFSKDGSRFAVKTSSHIGEIRDLQGNCYWGRKDVSVLHFTGTGHHAVIALDNGLIQVQLDKQIQRVALFTPKSVQSPSVTDLNDVRYSPAARRLSAVDNHGGIYMWSNREFLVPRKLPLHSAWPAILSPDGIRVVTTSKQQKIQLWNMLNQSLIADLDIGTSDLDNVIDMSFSFDSHFFTISTSQAYKIFDASDGSLVNSVSNQSDWEGPEVLRDGKLQFGTVVMDPESGTLFGSVPVRAFGYATSPSSTLLAVGTANGTLTIWDLTSRRIPGDLAEQVAISADGRTAVFISDHEAQVRSTLPAKELFSVHLDLPSSAVGLSKDGKLLGIVTSDGTLTIWSSGTRIYSQKSKVFQTARGLTFTNDGGLLFVLYASGSNAFTIKNGVVAPADGGSPIGNLIALSPDGGTVVVIKAAGADVVRSSDLHPLGHINARPSPWFPLTFSRDGGFLAFLSQNTVQILDCHTGEISGFPVQSGGIPSAFVFGGDGNKLLTLFPDKLELWDVKEKQRTWVQPSELGFSRAFFLPLRDAGGGQESDQYLLTVSRDGRVLQLWNTSDHSKRGDMKLPATFLGAPWFAADGRRILIVSTSGWVHSFQVRADGLIPDTNVILGGTSVRQVRILEDGTVVAKVSAGPRVKLSIARLDTNDNKTNTDVSDAGLKKLGQEFSLDQEGRPVVSPGVSAVPTRPGENPPHRTDSIPP